MSLNLTPMIDVVFLLLFFFLTVSRFRGNEGMLAAELASPSAETAVEIPRVPLRIRLKTSAADPAQCVVTIDDFHETTPLPIGQLSQVLNHIRNGQPGFDSDTPVQLYADEGVVWDHMTNAYNAAIAARFEKVFFD
jgi:biopolymer transport protein ExbD